MSAADIAEPIVDARPINVPSGRSAWDQAVAVRDRHAETIRRSLNNSGIDAIVLVSHPGVYPPWVRLEAWLPVSGAPDSRRSRREMELTVNALPYHEHTIVITASATRDNKRIAVANRPTHEFHDHHTAEWAVYTLGRGAKPSNYTPLTDALVGLLVAFLPFIPGPHHNPIDQRYRNAFGLTGAKCLGAVSLLLLVMGFGAPEDGGLLVAAVGAVGLIGTMAMVHHRARRVAVPDQPTVPPTNLVLVDSWNTAVSVLGSDAEELKRRISQSIGAEGASGITLTTQTYSYRTPTGYEQRDRMEAHKGTSVVHIHVYAFGDDLFVGWQAYLNRAQWGETGAVTHLVADGAVTEYRDLRPTFYAPGQLDLIDLSSLSELVHRHLTREIKSLAAEREIDEEIDFEIVRGNRDRALDRVRQDGDGDTRGGAWSRFARQAAFWQPRGETETVRGVAPPAGGHAGGTAYPVAILAGLLLAVTFLDRVNISYVALTMNRALGLSATDYGTAAAAMTWGYAALAIPSTAVLYRVGARRWIGNICIASGILAGAHAFVVGPTSLMVMRFLLGAAQAGIVPGMIFFFLSSFAPGQRARLVALFLAGIPLGVSVGAPISTALLGLDGLNGLSGWRWVFLVEAVPAVLLGLAVFAWLPDGPFRRSDDGSVVGQALRMMFDPRVLMVAIVYLTLTVAGFAGSFMMRDVMRRTGVSFAELSGAFVTSYAAGGVAMLIWAQLSDVMREHRLNLVLACAVGAAGCVVLANAAGMTGVTIAMALIGIGTYAARVQMFVLPAEFLSGAALAAAIGAVVTIGNAGGAFGGLFFGWLRDVGDYDTGLWLLAAVLLGSGMLAALISVAGSARGSH